MRVGTGARGRARGASHASAHVRCSVTRMRHPASGFHLQQATDGPRALLKRPNNLDGCCIPCELRLVGEGGPADRAIKVGIKSARGGDETRGPAWRGGNGVSVVHQRSVVHVCCSICGPCPG